MIGIVDYGSGNIGAISNIYTRQNIPHSVISNPDEVSSVDKLVLPGVGAFDETLDLLEKTGFRSALDDAVLGKNTQILGICVGMQVMATSSEEGVKPGLNWIPGIVRRFDKSTIPFKTKLPHMGWNSISPVSETTIFNGVDCAHGFYFLHSYFYECDDPGHNIAMAGYGTEFACAVNRDNVYGFQFHPEKSHSNGIAIFTNFAGI